jgi:hypothetical protein
MDVMVLLSPLHQAYLRLAGRRGYTVFEELVAKGGAGGGGLVVPMYMEIRGLWRLKERGGWEVLLSPLSPSDSNNSDAHCEGHPHDC